MSLANPYSVVVFYHGPKREWSGKISGDEVIFESQAPWLWLVRSVAKSRLGNKGRCGYAIAQGEKIVEIAGASDPAYGGAAA